MDTGIAFIALSLLCVGGYFYVARYTSRLAEENYLPRPFFSLVIALCAGAFLFFLFLSQIQLPPDTTLSGSTGELWAVLILICGGLVIRTKYRPSISLYPDTMELHRPDGVAATTVFKIKDITEINYRANKKLYIKTTPANELELSGLWWDKRTFASVARSLKDRNPAISLDAGAQELVAVAS